MLTQKLLPGFAIRRSDLVSRASLQFGHACLFELKRWYWRDVKSRRARIARFCVAVIERDLAAAFHRAGAVLAIGSQRASNLALVQALTRTRLRCGWGRGIHE